MVFYLFDFKCLNHKVHIRNKLKDFQKLSLYQEVKVIQYFSNLVYNTQGDFIYNQDINQSYLTLLKCSQVLIRLPYLQI